MFTEEDLIRDIHAIYEPYWCHRVRRDGGNYAGRCEKML